MTIRFACKEDINWIVDIGIKDMFTLLGKPEIFNSVYLKNNLIPYLIENGIVLVKEDYAVIIGMISTHPFNPEIKLASEYMWWVREDKRSSSIGYRLLLEFENMARSKSVNMITLSLMPNSKVHSLSKLGYVLNEFAFTKEI